jgi:hypothetical protein
VRGEVLGESPWAFFSGSRGTAGSPRELHKLSLLVSSHMAAGAPRNNSHTTLIAPTGTPSSRLGERGPPPRRRRQTLRERGELTPLDPPVWSAVVFPLPLSTRPRGARKPFSLTNHLPLRIDEGRTHRGCGEHRTMHGGTSKGSDKASRLADLFLARSREGGNWWWVPPSGREQGFLGLVLSYMTVDRFDAPVRVGLPI